MAETLSTLSIVSFIAAVLFFAAAIFLWFFFGIPSVIGDLNGRNARKSIARMRVTNERTGVKAYKESHTNVERGKLTNAMRESEKIKKARNSANEDKPETGLLSENAAETFASEGTSILAEEATGLLVDDDATMPLKPPVSVQRKRSGGKKLNMLEEVILIHTEEVIE